MQFIDSETVDENRDRIHSLGIRPCCGKQGKSRHLISAFLFKLLFEVPVAPLISQLPAHMPGKAVE